jgi:ribosomal protein S18 acetylase RimI-like enzyme
MIENSGWFEPKRLGFVRYTPHCLLQRKLLILPSEFQIRPGAPAVKDYIRLREITGLSPFSESAAQAGLAGTYFGVSVLYQDNVVGMGRIVGDGGLFFQIVDVAVDPRYQGRGIGFNVMLALTEYLKENAPTTAYVSLLADVPANRLYEKFGFIETAPETIGMARRV